MILRQNVTLNQFLQAKLFSNVKKKAENKVSYNLKFNIMSFFFVNPQPPSPDLTFFTSPFLGLLSNVAYIDFFNLRSR